MELQLIIAKFLGLVIFIGALGLKIPQIYNIISSKSAEGIVPISFYGEVFLYITSICYNILNGNPFSSYGEAVAIVVQNIILVFLLWIYKPKINYMEKLTVIILFITVFSISINLPKQFYPILALVNLPISIITKVPQLISNYKHKSTGTISIITTFLNFAGAGARIFTTIAEVGWDIYLLSSLLISGSLSGILLLQIIIYNRSKLSVKKND